MVRALVTLGILLTLGLAGCQTMTPEERRAADEQTCRSYGFRKGTDAFASCLLHLDLDRRAARRAMLHDDPFIYRPVIRP